MMGINLHIFRSIHGDSKINTLIFFHIQSRQMVALNLLHEDSRLFTTILHNRLGGFMLENLTSGGDSMHRQPGTANERLQKAIAERNLFLEQHPHLGTFQAEIDRLLDKSGNHEGRLSVIETLIQGKLMEMHRELNKLTGILQNTVAITSDSQS